MAEAIEGIIGDSFTHGALGLRFTASDKLDTPLQHVTETRFVSDKEQIHNGYVVMAEAKKNLVIQVGYKASVKNYGFGVRITRGTDNHRLVDALYFPNTGAKANTWTWGSIDVDDQGMQFLVRSNADLKSDYGKSAPYLKLTFIVWPIVKWKVGDKSYGKDRTGLIRAITRSASTVGIDVGELKGQGPGMRHARIVSEDFEKRQDLAVTFLTGDVKDLNEIHEE